MCENIFIQVKILFLLQFDGAKCKANMMNKDLSAKTKCLIAFLEDFFCSLLEFVLSVVNDVIDG